METENFWPSSEDILNAEEESPLTILKEQQEYLSKSFPSLDSRIQIVYTIGKEGSLFSQNFLGMSIKPQEISRCRFVVCKLIVFKKGMKYECEILRIRYSIDDHYPLEVMGIDIPLEYTVDTKEAFMNTLKNIFNSDRCKESLRYMLLGRLK